MVRPYASQAGLRGESDGGWTRKRRRRLPLTEALANLLSTERPDSVEPKCEDHAVLIAEPNIESVVLGRDRAAPPRIANSRRRTNQRAIPRERMFLEIKKHR